MLTLECLAGKDADAAGFVDAEQDAAGFPFSTY
jgi:hypothetical protein